MSRVPLQDTTENALNVASGKRSRTFQKPGHREYTAQAQQKADDDEEQLREWQRSWRKIMSRSKFYFDSVDPASVDRVRSCLNQLGAEIDAFFSTDVTLVVSRRVTQGVTLAPTDVLTRASQEGMKVWSYSKLLRFLYNLTGVTFQDSGASTLNQAGGSPVIQQNPTALQGGQEKLSSMLRQEKYLGPNDRDPTARREDYHYFKGPYLLVWDPSHHHRPTLHKEYAKKKDWPQLRATPGGMSPFLGESETAALRLHEQKRLNRQRQKEQLQLQQQQHRNEKGEIDGGVDGIPGGTETVPATPVNDGLGDDNRTDVNEDDGYSHSGEEADTDNAGNTRTQSGHQHVAGDRPAKLQIQTQFKDAVPAFSGSSRLFHIHHDNASKYYDIAASGINKSTSTSATRSAAQSTGEQQSGGGAAGRGNGLCPPGTQASRELNNLKRKVLSSKLKRELPVISEQANNNDAKRSKIGPSARTKPTGGKEDRKDDAQLVSTAKGSKPGYCENCQVQFDRFDDHVLSKKHLKYATNPDNFIKLDKWLAHLARF